MHVFLPNTDQTVYTINVTHNAHPGYHCIKHTRTTIMVSTGVERRGRYMCMCKLTHETHPHILLLLPLYGYLPFSFINSIWDGQPPVRPWAVTILWRCVCGWCVWASVRAVQFVPAIKLNHRKRKQTTHPPTHFAQRSPAVYSSTRVL